MKITSLKMVQMMLLTRMVNFDGLIEEDGLADQFFELKLGYFEEKLYISRLIIRACLLLKCNVAKALPNL
jgi:hypothetical protein